MVWKQPGEEMESPQLAFLLSKEGNAYAGWEVAAAANRSGPTLQTYPVV